MAYVTAVVGAGGKTGYIRRRAHENAAAGKRTAVMTTTHIMEEPDEEQIIFLGTPCEEGPEGMHKLTWPGGEVYRKACLEYDEILIEADGAKHHPLKIPAHYEPVIPDNTDEIVIVMSAFAIGRGFREICFRSRLADEEIVNRTEKEPFVTRELVNRIAEKYYIRPLSERYPNAEIRYYFHEEIPGKSGPVKLLAVLMASGESRRFGKENKLLAQYRGKALYRWQLDALQAAAHSFCPSEKGSTDAGIENDLRMDIAVVSSHDSILDEINPGGGMIPLRNEKYREGIAASIRLGARYAKAHGYDAAAFFAADQPAFGAADVEDLLRQYILSGKKMACAFSSHPANPAVFASSMFDALAALQGDTGAMRLIKADPGNVHYYIVKEEKLKDVDTPEDLAGTEGGN